MKKIILTIILYAIAIALTFVSIAPNTKVILFVLMISIVAGSLMSLTLVVWYEGNFREKIIQAAAVGFPLAAGSFILGYTYIIVESLIRK
ncbi:MAG: hypothetical protein ACXVPQ_05540 [Bacteroidia bacterium]